MHRYTDETERVARAVLGYARDRLRLHPVPLDGPRTAEELTEAAGETITEDGLGGEAALRLFAEVLAPAIISIDNPRFLAFIPAAPTELVDAVRPRGRRRRRSTPGHGGGSGAVYAENQALRLARPTGRPSGDDGGLLRLGRHDRQPFGAGRRPARPPRGARRRRRPLRVACTDETHSSVATAASVMDVGLLRIAPDTRGRMTGEALAAAIEAEGTEGSSPWRPRPARPTSASSTTWPASPPSAREHGLWLHVDGAYGGAALAAPSVRDRFAGIEHADSFIVDPHKWLFAPFDSCALLYRNPELARAAHTPARRLPRARAGQRAATRPTTPSTSPGGRAACPSGSRSRRTGRAPTPRRSSTRWTSPARPRTRSESRPLRRAR